MFFAGHPGFLVILLQDPTCFYGSRPMECPDLNTWFIPIKTDIILQRNISFVVINSFMLWFNMVFVKNFGKNRKFLVFTGAIPANLDFGYLHIDMLVDS